mgnify:CR=1 FL=1
MNQPKILVVDDDKEIVGAIKKRLEMEDYEIITAYDGLEAMDILMEQEVQLLIIDVMMPKMDGLSATMKIRESKNIPIIILSAKTEESDKILGLSMGADDYISKPFRPDELVARVKSQLRRYMQFGGMNAAESNKEQIINGGLILDMKGKRMMVDGEPVKLTATEYKIVSLLMNNLGRVFSADEIYERVWNEEAYATENTVMVHIRRIREKIEIEKPDGQIEVVHAAKEIKATQTTIPFFKSNNFDYADLVGFMGEHAQTAGWILFVIITIFVVTAVSNGANLNDGMDGMAAGNSAIIGLTLGILAYVSSHIEYAGYLNIMYIPGSEELVIFICAFIGALIGFLWYNAYPAQVFMGDTGSLTIGGIIAVYAIIIHKELLIPILCGIFLVENLSVILQRLYYKAGKRKGVKQRLFKRTPIHDHFRTSMSLIEPGCSVVFTKPDKLFHESKITIRFWIVTIVLAAITIITLKIR